MKKIVYALVLSGMSALTNAQMMAMFTGRQLQMGYDKVQCEYQLNGMYYYLVFRGYYCPAMVEI